MGVWKGVCFPTRAKNELQASTLLADGYEKHSTLSVYGAGGHHV